MREAKRTKNDTNLYCTICETKFSRKDSLQRHMKINTNIYCASSSMSYVGSEFSDKTF